MHEVPDDEIIFGIAGFADDTQLVVDARPVLVCGVLRGRDQRAKCQLFLKALKGKSAQIRCSLGAVRCTVYGKIQAVKGEIKMTAVCDALRVAHRLLLLLAPKQVG